MEADLSPVNNEKCSGSEPNTVTMLCIDGGGIRGLIPATILIELEKQLQVASGRETAHISHYFDVIAGTSTGGIIATMLTAPNPDNINEPYFRPKKIQEYYVDNGPKIFHRPSFPPPFVKGPKYDGKELRSQLENMLKFKTNTPMKVADTKTNVVIPTYDIYDFKPVIFSSFKVNGKGSNPNYMNANLSDICLGTSAAPLYFPPVGFSTTSSENEMKFNLVDGGVIAINPTLMAVNEVVADRMRKDQAIPSIKKFIVLSLGTGSSKDYEKFTAEQAAKWGILGWVGINTPWTPILDIFFQGSADVVDISTQNLFKSVDSLENYLRVQIDTLEGPAASLDDTTPENLANLIKIANDLLDSPATRINEYTGRLSSDETDGSTYRERIKELAKKLVEGKGY